VRVASVAGAFPSGQSPLQERLDEIRDAVADGADEIDIVLNRGALLSGRIGQVYDEVAASKDACGDAHLKTILETGELGSYEAVRLAAMVAMAAGSDAIKTSTGKLPASATPAMALCMAEAIREHADATGREVGLKLAGGIRTSKQALGYLAIVAETLGTAWLTPERFRLGASTLLNDIVLQLHFARTGRYGRTDDLPVD
jgi:deoxyribose-phosphate aldolase